MINVFVITGETSERKEDRRYQWCQRRAREEKKRQTNTSTIYSSYFSNDQTGSRRSFDSANQNKVKRV